MNQGFASKIQNPKSKIGMKYFSFRHKYSIRDYRRFCVFILWTLLGIVLAVVLGVGILPVSLPKSLPLAIAHAQVVSETAQQEQQGRVYYETESFAQAIQVWQQVLQVYQSRQDRLNQARVLSNLALAYQKLGQWPQATQAISASLQFASAQQGKYSQAELKVLAQALNTQGSLQLAKGDTQAALTTWEKAHSKYTQAQDERGVIRTLVNQAQALKVLGLHRQALSRLNQAHEILQKQPESLIKAAALRNLGINLRLVGNVVQAKQVLQQSLAIAQKLQSPLDISAAFIDLGNVARVQSDLPAALQLYTQAAATSPSQYLQVRAQLNQLNVAIDTKQWTLAQSLQQSIPAKLTALPNSRHTIYAQLNFAQSLVRLQQADIPDTPNLEKIAQLVANTVVQAENLGDRYAQAYARGKLGRLYEKTQQWSIAEDLTQQALALAETINAPELAYSWQWQLGRILRKQGEITKAIAAYTQAVNTLKSLRNDLVAVDPDIQFSFQESVEPVYRGLVSLLLQPNQQSDSEALNQARQLMESLQVAELEDFFREACLDLKPTLIDKFDNQAAIVYPIILADRLEIVLSLPQKPLQHYSIPVPQTELETTVEKLRQMLVIRSRKSFLPLSRKLYDWLIRPVENDLETSQTKTLVFVLDGVLRNIPMNSLNDGQKYLLEKYAIALTPGLQLLPSLKLQQEKVQVLGAGLTEARQGFSALDYVAQEMKMIKSKISSQVLLNQEFTLKNLRNKIQDDFFPIVHIATHGKFSSRAIDTFILAWNEKIKIDDLDNLLQAPGKKPQKAVELLVLSACETATGDKRAALGLAGIAVRTGVRSTLATLWSVNDEATAELMGLFYKELTNTKQSKAEALRQAQLTLLKNPKYEHPVYWSPYILVGNWL
ncbi:CHAT domain-containing protein [Nostoc sp. CMAA1605]|uniref:CHAT domain-containing protein n=1 Tax=Nostoc sp. CMAA1605 TaxID=2055159 RepID=UPI001F343292|nr:CHAT domain-containing protein [Nostoc sp. CMAA1605]